MCHKSCQFSWFVQGCCNPSSRVVWTHEPMFLIICTTTRSFDHSILGWVCYHHTVTKLLWNCLKNVSRIFLGIHFNLGQKTFSTEFSAASYDSGSKYRRDDGRRLLVCDQNHNYDQGILRGKVSLYCWPPVWLVWNQLYVNWQYLFLFAEQTNPNQSNRRSTVQWYFPL